MYMKNIDDSMSTILYQKCPSISNIDDIVKEHENTGVPIYKYILFKFCRSYYDNAQKSGYEAYSYNKMKTEYGLSNNLNNYFNIQPNSKYGLNPQRISEDNAYKLIFLLHIPVEYADLLLESIGVIRLSSPIASKRQKSILYSLKCKHTLPHLNELLFKNGYNTLY